MITGVPSTVADLNSLYPDIYDDTLFVARDRTLMAGLVTQAQGSTFAVRYIPIYNQITASSVSEGGTPTAQQLTKGTADTVTPASIRTKVGVTDERIMTDPDEPRSAIPNEAGMAIAQKIDTDLLGEFANFTGGDTGTAGSALTLARCAGAIAVLQSKNAAGMPNIVLHPFSWFSVWKELTQAGVTTRAANADDTANQAMQDYLVNNFQGANWYISNNLGTGTATVNGAFHREAIMLDTRSPLEQEVARDADSNSWYYYHTVRYGTGTPRPTFGVKLTATASTPTF